MQTAELAAGDSASRNASDLARDLAAMKQELDHVKSEVASLRVKCSEMNKTLLMLCCPKEWYTEEIDEVKLEAALSQANEGPSFQEFIESLKNT